MTNHYFLATATYIKYNYIILPSITYQNVYCHLIKIKRKHEINQREKQLYCPLINQISQPIKTATKNTCTVCQLLQP